MNFLVQVFGFGGMSMQMSMYAVVHNAASFTRDMTIGVRVDRRSADLLKGSTLFVLGARGERLGANARVAVANNSVLTLAKMRPGENRWIEMVYTPPPNVKDPTPVELYELVNGIAVNGYAFLPTPMPLSRALVETMLEHAAVFTRLGELYGLDSARTHAKLALELAQKDAADAYPRFLVEHTAEMVRANRGGNQEGGRRGRDLPGGCGERSQRRRKEGAGSARAREIDRRASACAPRAPARADHNFGRRPTR